MRNWSMAYQFKITADLWDPKDPECKRANAQRVELAKEYSCTRHIEQIGSFKVGVFTYPTHDSCLRFQNSRQHIDTMAKMREFYRTMSVARRVN